MAVNKFHYPHTLSFYDSEGRERKGYIQSFQRWGADAGNYLDFTDAYYQYFFIDFTNNTDWVTVLELSNGVKMQCKPRSVVTPTGGQQVVYIDYRFLSSNGSTTIASAYSTVILDTGHYNDISNVKTLVTYNRTYYSNDVSLLNIAANNVDIGFTLWLELTNETGLYPTPTQKYALSFWNENYSNILCNPLGGAYDDTALQNLINRLNNAGDGTIITPILPSEDTSNIGGGDSANPDYNPFSDPINFPDLPTGGSALSSGFIKLYRPTSGELNQLATKLWSDSFIDEIKKIQNDPLEAIISLHSVPFGIVGASRQNCRIGNYDSEIVMDTIGAQFYTVDCGNIAIPEHWASALDYAPYTDIEIYLPFCGVKPLQIDDVMNRVLNVKYNIDILTGAAICMVKCGDSVLYTYNTEIAQNIPISASNHAQLYQSIISAASAVVGVASGGAGAVVGAVQSAATVAASKHSQVSRGGSLGGSVGVLGDFVPYLIIHRPIQSLAADFAHKKGYPSNITATLSSVSGYTEVDSIHLENIPCTDMEREELYRILKEGVIL